MTSVFTRVWFLALATLILVGVALAIYSFATKGFVHDQVYAHEQSVAYDDNRSGESTLEAGCCQQPDRILRARDTSCNGYDFRARAFNNGNLVGVARDDNGCGLGTGWVPLNVNADKHDGCTGARDGSLFGCGPNSDHTANGFALLGLGYIIMLVVRRLLNIEIDQAEIVRRL